MGHLRLSRAEKENSGVLFPPKLLLTDHLTPQAAVSNTIQGALYIQIGQIWLNYLWKSGYFCQDLVLIVVGGVHKILVEYHSSSKDSFT